MNKVIKDILAELDAVASPKGAGHGIQFGRHRPTRASRPNRRWHLFLAVIAVLAGTTLAAPVRAQQAVSLASLQISIWPEYDRPASLVILDGVVASGVALPAPLTVRMPAAAITPSAVATTGANGSLLQATYTTAADGEDIIIKFTTTSAAFRVEYYDPGLVVSGDTRSFAFRWKSDFAVAQASVRVQEPVGASSLTGQPALTPAGTGEFGLSYDTLNLGALPAGGIVSEDIRYTKSGSTLSVAAVAPPTAPAQPAVVAGGTPRWLPGVLAAGALGLAAAGGGAFWYTRWGAKRQPAARRSARPAGRGRTGPGRLNQTGAQPPAARQLVSGAAPGVTNRPAATTLKDAPARFCTQCGQRHQPGDRFCRQCGTPARD